MPDRRRLTHFPLITAALVLGVALIAALTSCGDGRSSSQKPAPPVTPSPVPRSGVAGAASAPTDAPPQQSEPLEAFTPITAEDGFFFHFDKYFPPPYRITVDVEGLKINGILVSPMLTTPRGKPPAKTDPGPFKWTPELLAQGISKSGFVQHTSRRYSYWRGQHGVERAVQLVEEYLAQQPMITKTERGDEGDHSIAYWTKDGEMRGMSFSVRPPRDPGKRRGELERKAEFMRHVFAEGGMYIVGRGNTTLPPKVVRRVLASLDRLFTSAAPEGDRIERLVTSRPPLDRETAVLLVKAFNESEALRQRAELLRASSGARPHDHPAEDEEPR